MTRIVKDYDDRYDQFLDVAQALFFEKSYDQTSVQDIINAVGVAKGTFYHYFGSKADLLQAVVERMYDQTLKMVFPIILDEERSAVQKLKDFFTEIGQWKISYKDQLMPMLRALYKDENLLLREKMRQEAISTGAELVAEIIAQGIGEGVFHVDYPYATAEIILALPRRFSETLIDVLLSGKRDPLILGMMEEQVPERGAYSGHATGYADAVCC